MTLSVKSLGRFWHSDAHLNERFFYFVNLSLLTLKLFPSVFSDRAVSHAHNSSIL
jgi:hypothetical protein